jgi:hypothetical protein
MENYLCVVIDTPSREIKVTVENGRGSIHYFELEDKTPPDPDTPPSSLKIELDPRNGDALINGLRMPNRARQLLIEFLSQPAKF